MAQHEGQDLSTSSSTPGSPSGQGWAALGAAMVGVAVALGAFGAHALKTRLPADLLVIFETGNRYHFYHGLGLLLLGLLGPSLSAEAVRRVGWCFAGGLLLFSGSLYLLAVTGVRKLGMITPIGGVLFIVGWSLFALGLWQTRRRSSP